MEPSEKRPRRFRITIRVSLSERQTLEAAAERSCITLSAYARHALLNARPLRSARKPSLDVSVLVCVLDRLGNVASTLRAISLMVGTQSGFTLPAFERDLARTLTELREIRPKLLEALGKGPAP